MINGSTELVPGLLWAGGLEAIAVTPTSVVKIITVLHTSAGAMNYSVVHCWLRATNDEVLSPAQIEAAVAGKVPTLVHCQLGQNRSTAIAICWLRRNLHVVGDVKLGNLDDTIRWVVEERTRDLKHLGRAAAELSPAMRDNVNRYEEWLRTK